MVVPRVLVGVLYSGEPGLARTVASAKSQVEVETEILLVENLPKWEAHSELFRRFTDLGSDFDLLVKLDADMRIVNPRFFIATASLFSSEAGLDHVILGVDDWMSGQRIQGIQLWRGGVRWESPPPDLFTDLPRSTAGEKWSRVDIGTAIVMHAEDPTETQALRYGAHRGLKAARSGKASRLERLSAFAHFVVANPAPQRLLALAAVELALQDERAGRLLVDGTEPVPEELLHGLRRRAKAPDAMLAAVLPRIDELMPAPLAEPKPRGAGNLRSRVAVLLRGSELRRTRPVRDLDDARRTTALLSVLLEG